MPGIFDEEQRVTGPIWPNPCRTTPISPLDGVIKRLKWCTLRRVSRLASNKMGAAGAAKEFRETL